MKGIVYTLLAVSFFVFLISFIGFIYSREPIQTTTFFASLNVSDRVGFDVDDSALIFGSVIRGGGSSRNINIDNNFQFPVVAVISAEGDIAPLLHFDNLVEIGENEFGELSFNVIAPSDINDGFYSGNVTIEIFRK